MASAAGEHKVEAHRRVKSIADVELKDEVHRRVKSFTSSQYFEILQQSNIVEDEVSNPIHEAIVVDDVGEGGGGVCILLEEGQAGTEMGKDDKMVALLPDHDAEIARKKNMIALGLVALSAFVYSLQSLNVAVLGETFDFWTLSLSRGLVGAICCLLARKKKESSFGYHQNFLALMTRGLLGGLTITTAFFAITHWNLAEASVVIFTAPLWTAILALVLEKGTWHWVDTVSAICCFLGMIFITQPPGIFARGEGEDFVKVLPGFFSAIFSAISMAGVNISIRKLKNEDPSVVTFYAMIGSIVISFPGFVVERLRQGGFHVPAPMALNIFLLAITGVLSFCAQVSKTRALQIAKSVGVLVMRYLDIFFSYVWQVLVLKDKVSIWGIIGASLITGSCMLSVIVKAREK